MEEIELQNALPKLWIRIAAMLSIAMGGVFGAAIGNGLARASCGLDASCVKTRGIAIVLGALITAAGIAVVAVLSLRAMDEWNLSNASSAKGIHSTKQDGRPSPRGC